MVCTSAAANARMGVIKGAMSIAPITTAALSLPSPNAAIIADSPMSTT